LLGGLDADREQAVKELTSAGLWLLVPGGWEIPRWRETQSTIEEIEHNRENNRGRQQRYRKRQAEAVTQDVTRDVTRDVTGVVGKGREGQGRDSRTGSSTYRYVTNPRTEEENGNLCENCRMRAVSDSLRAETRHKFGRVLCSACAPEAFVR
jgi:hypothetical protein